MQALQHWLADNLKAVTPASARRWVVKRRLQIRRVSARQRLLPDFLVIGAQRCGTSSLYKYLGRHPHVAPSLRKEVEYLSIRYRMGESWYRTHFPLRSRQTVHEYLVRTPLLTFEATPDYLLDPRAPERAAVLVPDAKLIVLLRNPVDRAYSHYLHMRRLGLEDLPFEDALDAEDQRLKRDLEMMQEDPHHRASSFRRYSYVTRGEYAVQLQRWLRYYPKDRIFVGRSEDFFVDPGPVFSEIEDFLGLPTWKPEEFANYSYNGPSPDRAEMSPATRERLTSVFAPQNERLEELLGYGMNWDS